MAPSLLGRRRGFSHRQMTAFISAVYILYLILSIVALVRIGDGDYKFGLVVPIVTATLHFATGTVGLLSMDGRRAQRTNVANLATVADWAMAFALGIASSSVNRTHLENEVLSAVMANVLLILGQLVCAAKTYDLLDPDRFDQDTGEALT